MRPTYSFIKERFDIFNRQMFEGSLPAVPLKIGRGKQILGSLRWKYKRTLTGQITITDISITVSNVYDRSEREIEDILIHEMIHLSELTKLGRPEENTHGVFFRREMQRINSTYGRNVTIRDNLSDEIRNTDNRFELNIFGVIYFSDGGVGLTKIARSRYMQLRREWENLKNVERIDWYYTCSPLLSKLKRVQTLKYYRLSTDEINKIIADNSTKSMDSLK